VADRCWMERAHSELLVIDIVFLSGVAWEKIGEILLFPRKQGTRKPEQKSLGGYGIILEQEFQCAPLIVGMKAVDSSAQITLSFCGKCCFFP